MKPFTVKLLTGLLCLAIIESIFVENIKAAEGDNSAVLNSLNSPETNLSLIEDSGELERNVGEINGKVIDQKSGEPISYASVALLIDGENSIYSGVISNENGEFTFKDLPFGVYDVKISFVGYEAKEIENISVNRKSRKVSLESLALEENVEEIEEVVFTAERLKGEEKIDRTTFTLNDDLRKTSSDGLDVLKHIPSVQVDFQDNVTLEGQSNIQFYVDGVLRNKDYVAQLDPQMIDKVEIISNPGVKYDADVAGVINIVMKKTKRYGLNGSFTVPIPHPKKVVANAKGNLEYGNSKFRVYAGGRLHMERFNGNESLYTETDDSYVNPYKFYKQSNGDIGWSHGYMNYGADWFVSEKTSINFLGEWRIGRGFNNDYFSTNRRYENDVLTNYFTSNLNARENRDNHYLSLFLKQKMPQEGSELTAEAYVYLHSSESKNNYLDTYYDPFDEETVTDVIERKDLTVNNGNTAEFRLDYTFLIKNIKNEVGLRSYKQWVDNDFSDVFDSELNPEGYTDNFKFNETRQTGYYNLLGKKEKLSWQAGVRGEYSDLNINDTVSKDYFVFLPQVSLSYAVNKENTFKLSFRRQIHRPSVHSLNPFETWSDSLHVRTGNPDLNPALENKLEFSYAKNFGSNYISPKVYLRYTRDRIQDLSVVREDGVTEITQANIGKDLEYGIGLNAAIQVLKRWRVNGNFTVYNKKVGSEYNLSNEDDNEKISYRFNMMNLVMLPKDFTFMVLAQYNSPYISYQRTHYRDFLMLIGFEKQLGKNAKIGGFYNPFIKDFTYSKVITQSPGYYEDWKGYLDVHHLFSFEFTYNFKLGGKVNKIGRQAEYEIDEGGGTF